MRFVIVPHGPKLDNLGDVPDQIKANPPMTPGGMQKILDLVPTIKTLGPYQHFVVSRSARALDTASIIATELDLDFETDYYLTVYANKDGNTVYYGPGHEEDNFVLWQTNGLTALRDAHDWVVEDNKVEQKFLHDLDHKDLAVLVVCHRPILAGLVGAARGIRDEAELNKLANDPALVKDGLVILDTDDGQTFKVTDLAWAVV